MALSASYISEGYFIYDRNI